MHKFKLLTNKPFRLDQYVQIEYPDDTPRIRFLLNEFKDTIKLEVIERNPKDSFNWSSEKIIDTVILVRKK